MHYEIDTVKKDDPFGEILHSARRQTGDTGKAQAYNLARRLGSEDDGVTILITEVISREERDLVAAFNPNADIRGKYPNIEILSNKRYNRFIKIATETLEKEVEEKGHDAIEVYEHLKDALAHAWEQFNGPSTARHDN